MVLLPDKGLVYGPKCVGFGLPVDDGGNYYVALPCQQDERSEAAARLPSALMGLGTALVTFWLGRTMLDRRAGLLGGTTIAYQESVLDEATLQQVADITGGRYYRAEDTEGLRAIYNEINQLEQSQIEVQVFNQHQELMIWLLLPALIILLLEAMMRNTMFRRVP